MADDLLEITSDEFDRWVPPVGTLAPLRRLAGGMVIREIMARLRNGLIHAVAETAGWDSPRQGRVAIDLHPIPREWWSMLHDAALAHADFWKTGRVTIRVSDGAGGKPVDLFGVRFSPLHVDKLIQDLVPAMAAVPPLPPRRTDHFARIWPQTPSPHDDDPSTPFLPSTSAPQIVVSPAALPRSRDFVSPDEINEWHRGLNAKDQARSIRWLRKAAQDAHPGRRVLQKYIDPFANGRKRGRPLKQ